MSDPPVRGSPPVFWVVGAALDIRYLFCLGRHASGTAAGGAAVDRAEMVIGGLALAGLAVSGAYPTGRHVLDGAFAAHGVPMALICDLHPSGIDAHIDRHLALLRSGWSVGDALASTWCERRGELTASLVADLRPDRA